MPKSTHLLLATHPISIYIGSDIKNSPQRMYADFTDKILKHLKTVWPDAKIELRYKNAFELLIATILSAQSTDIGVNSVTDELFKKYPAPQDLAAAHIEELINIIKPTGFFNNKAKNISNCSKMLVEKHDGKVPNTLEQLVALPGVGRKTANVVLGAAFGVPGIVVDTHVKRVAARLGLTAETAAAKIEADLMTKVAKSNWIDFSILLVLHGRYICKARRPLCDQCLLSNLCPWANKQN